MPAGTMARTSAALLATAILAASAVHVVYAGIQSTTGLQYPGITGVIPACVRSMTPPAFAALRANHEEELLLHSYSLLDAVAAGCLLMSLLEFSSRCLEATQHRPAVDGHTLLMHRACEGGTNEE